MPRSTDRGEPAGILVYGTLRSGMGNDRIWRAKSGRSVPAMLPGARLYDLSFGFPAVVLGDCGLEPGEPVHGELISCEDMLGVLLALDRLEGYDPDRPPERNHYQRMLVDVEVPSGERLPAWIYVYDAERLRQVEGAELVPHGDWCAWLQAREESRDVR